MNSEYQTTPSRPSYGKVTTTHENITYKRAFPAGHHKAAMNRQESITITIIHKRTAGTVSKNILTGGLKLVLWYQQMSIKTNRCLVRMKDP